MSEPIGQPLFDRLKAIGAEMSNHESDLYVKWSPEVKAVLDEMEAEGRPWHYTMFQSDGATWADIAFAYAPWWEARRPRP